jgi:hypothetical protein
MSLQPKTSPFFSLSNVYITFLSDKKQYMVNKKKMQAVFSVYPVKTYEQIEIVENCPHQTKL